MSWEGWVTLLYGGLLFWTTMASQDQSYPPFSLGRGFAGSLVTISCGLGVLFDYTLAKPIGVTVVSLIVLYLAYRFYKTKKWIPTGVLAILGFFVAQALGTWVN